jgi:hypothetical protein
LSVAASCLEATALKVYRDRLVTEFEGRSNLFLGKSSNVEEANHGLSWTEIVLLLKSGYQGCRALAYGGMLVALC